jgi:hypothetical protein
VTEGLDLGALIAGSELDRAAIERLKNADRGAMKKMLSEYLPSEQVEKALARIDALIRAAEEQRE